MNAADIQTILHIMSDARVSAFFKQDDIVQMIMSGGQPADADVERIVQNVPLNRIVQDEPLMQKIMEIQNKLSSQFEARDQDRKMQLAKVLVELGFAQDSVDNAIASQRDGSGHHPLGVLTALRATAAATSAPSAATAPGATAPGATAPGATAATPAETAAPD